MLALRVIPVAVSLGCLTSLAADNLRPCADVVACRWPLAGQQFAPAPPEAADTLINDTTAGEGFEVQSVRHYEP